jgi:hypothetical protein
MVWFTFFLSLDRYGSFLGYALSMVDRRGGGGRAKMIRLLGLVREVLKNLPFDLFFLAAILTGAVEMRA